MRLLHAAHVTLETVLTNILIAIKFYAARKPRFHSVSVGLEATQLGEVRDRSLSGLSIYVSRVGRQ